MMRWLVIAGPTASGKSAVALEIAERYGGEIVNADSRQIYRFMDVGTAKPSVAERRRVPHHLFDVVTPDVRFDVSRYRDLARAAVAEIAARGRLPIVVGGTGLYIRALARGLFRGPVASPRLRRVLETLEATTPGTLHRWCRRLDPVVARRVHPNDRVRLVRALEVALASGATISAQQASHAFADRLGTMRYLVLDPGAERLAERIRSRTVSLFERGLVEEVRALSRRGYRPELPAMRSIGYLEAGRVIRGECSAEAAIEATIRSTARFAKRQRTWFRAEKEAVWIHPDDRKRILSEVDRLQSVACAE
jgi:tRNA dimethylallyltransferase